MKWGIILAETGYIPGAFDLFHVGHLRYLQNAKALCDRLIVGVLTDEVIMEYKGILPSIPLQQRMEIIRALECTDAVVEAHTRDVYAEWEKMAFDVVFIGDDWFGDEQWADWRSKLEKECVIIRYLPRNCHISTTNIRASIKER